VIAIKFNPKNKLLDIAETEFHASFKPKKIKAENGFPKRSIHLLCPIGKTSYDTPL